jgi:hypothetical protein
VTTFGPLSKHIASGGRGPFGWIGALPWQNPIMLAVAFSFVLLGFGGAGGLINMSYQLNAPPRSMLRPCDGDVAPASYA